MAAADPGGHLRRALSGGGEEFYGLRGYRPGDRLRSIDWRHSARTGQLISREMTLPAPPRLALLLDVREEKTEGGRRKVEAGNDATSRPSAPSAKGSRPQPAAYSLQPHDAVEQAISLAASLICAAHLQGYATGLSVRGAAAPQFAARHGVLHRGRLLETLALLDMRQPQPPGGAAPSEATLIVRAGPAGAGASGRQCVVLSAADMAQYVTAPRSGRAVALLAWGRGWHRAAAGQGGGPWT